VEGDCMDAVEKGRDMRRSFLALRWQGAQCAHRELRENGCHRSPPEGQGKESRGAGGIDSSSVLYFN
jgi:hypothetical protein